MNGINESQKTPEPVQSVKAHTGTSQEGRKRKCKKCGNNKPFLEFYKEKKIKDGYMNQCKACYSEYKKKYCKDRPESMARYRKKYRLNNRNKINEKERNKRVSDPNFKLASIFRWSIRDAIKKQAGKKSTRTKELLGCSVSHARNHLESLFQDGMTWENHGVHGWHIDHVKPCVGFDLTDPKQQKECFHYTNLQPLWAKDNLKKGFKQPEIPWDKPLQPVFIEVEDESTYQRNS